MKDIQKQTDTELQKTLREKRQKLQQFRFSVSGSKVRDIKEGKSLRADIARLLTEANNRKNNTSHTNSA